MVVKGQQYFMLSLEACQTGIIDYSRARQQTDLVYVRSTKIRNGLPVFKFNRESET